MLLRRDATIVFDLDDTLFAEMDYVRSGYESVASFVRSRFGTECHALLATALEENRLDGIFQRACKEFGLPISAIDEMVLTYRSHIPRIALRPGAMELLRLLKADKRAVGCLTDGRSISQRLKITALGISELLDFVVISEEIGACKPAVLPYKKCMEYSSSSQYIYIADNPAKDFVTPKKLGWVTIGVKGDGRNVHAQQVCSTTEYQPDIWVADFTELTDTLGYSLSDRQQHLIRDQR